ncbi:MAG: glycosyltransferase [Lactovum sp.]
MEKEKKEKEVIDILFPYYGDIKLMKEAVASVLKQSYTNWRLLVFDDGMPGDEVEDFFKNLIKEEIKNTGKTRIFYHRNVENLGANKNFRQALDQAESNYYVMMGADDLMKENFLSHFIDILSQSSERIDIYQPNIEVIDEKGKVYLPMVDRVKSWLMPKKSGIYRGENLAKTYIHGWHYFPSMIWRTALAKKVGFHPDYVTLQDVYQGLDILQDSGSLYLDRDCISFSYRRHSQSDSSLKALNGIRFEQEKKFYQQKEKEFLALGWKHAAISARRHYWSRLNALSLIPKAILSKEGQAKKLFRHFLNLN